MPKAPAEDTPARRRAPRERPSRHELLVGARAHFEGVKESDSGYLRPLKEAARRCVRGQGPLVEPTGSIEDDPNLTGKKFLGNPTKSYRTRAPLRVTGEITGWKGHAPEQLQAMKDHLARLAEQGIEAIEE